ncbi:hypothetical protein BMF94_3802 [Rhodotorula taiwanensis]|uniref:Small monomeric GTPase n=1 Tax=Rhodotorula taiwanensis TaxID=741276 RepID=A0A2S5B8S3_9BASI|nr:hypothetical protein BMF94_3802 [Rhodotorula taiwanensis]
MASHPLSAPPPAEPAAPIPAAPPTILKVVLIGDAATGKTSFRERFVKDRFTGSYRATIGCDFLGRVVKVDRIPGHSGAANKGENEGEADTEEDEDDEARLQVWDTAGQERFRSLAPAFYRSSDACLLLYSLASSTSPDKIAESISTWFHEFCVKCPVQDPRLFSWACVGTKADEVRGDPEKEARAKQIQDAVDEVLRKLVPTGATSEDLEGKNPTARPAPTVSVEVLPPRHSREAAGRRRQKRDAASKPSAPISRSSELPRVVVDGQQVDPAKLDPNSTDRNPDVQIDRPTSSRTTTASSAADSIATTETAATFELNAPIADLLVATSPPSAPAHFGPAGAPPAVYVGGPYKDPEGRILGTDDVDAVLEEGGGAPDHRREGSEQTNGIANGRSGPNGRETEEDSDGEACELEREERRYEEEGIRHFRWTSAKTGEGVQEVFEHLARRVLAIRRAEALSEDEHAGTPYVRDSHPQRRHHHQRGASKDADSVIRIGERESLTFGQRMKQACCS